MINNINQEKVDKWLCIYLLFFFIYTLIGRIIPITSILEGPINSIIFILFALFGSIFVGIDFFTRRYMFEPKYTWWLICFIIVMGISSFINYDYGFFDNFKTLVWTTIHFMLLYSLPKRGTHEQRHRYLNILILTMTVIFGIAVVISLIQYALQINYTVFYIDRYYRQGFVDNRLFGIFTDPNYAASTALVSFLGSLYLMLRTKNSFIRGISLFNALLQIAYIVLSGSRSVLIAYVVTMIIVIFLLVRRYALIHADKGERTFYSIIGMILACIISLGTYQGTKIICEAVPIILNTADNQGLLDREDVDEANISNNRFQIWDGYIRSTLNSDRVLFGLSPRNAVRYIQANDSESYIAQTGYDTHNAYVSIFAFTGVVGSIIMVVFISLSIKNAFTHVFIDKDYSVEFTISLAIVGGLACYAFFITDLFFMNNASTLVFWPLLGYINSYKSRWKLWQS